MDSDFKYILIWFCIVDYCIGYWFYLFVTAALLHTLNELMNLLFTLNYKHHFSPHKLLEKYPSSHLNLWLLGNYTFGTLLRALPA